MTMVDEDEETILNTHRGVPFQGTGPGGAPANYRQMKWMMGRIVADMKAQGITNPSNQDVMKEYSRRMKARRE